MSCKVTKFYHPEHSGQNQFRKNQENQSYRESNPGLPNSGSTVQTVGHNDYAQQFGVF